MALDVCSRKDFSLHGGQGEKGVGERWGGVGREIWHRLYFPRLVSCNPLCPATVPHCEKFPPTSPNSRPTYGPNRSIQEPVGDTQSQIIGPPSHSWAGEVTNRDLDSFASLVLTVSVLQSPFLFFPLLRLPA